MLPLRLPHLVRDCPVVPMFRRWWKDQLLKEKSKQKSQKDAKSHHKRKDKKHRAYNAGDDLETSSLSPSSGSDEEGIEETGALSKELACKLPPSEWVADSGASSHMTDQVRLFRKPLMSIRRRTIKVGEGKLYADHRGTAVLQTLDRRKALLHDVLYVPDLGCNLLSGRKMCQRGLHGSFDDSNLTMHDSNGKLM